MADWESYLTEVGEDLCRILVDLDLTPSLEAPYLTIARLYLAAPDGQGLLTDAEQDVVDRFEEHLSLVSEPLSKVAYVGRANFRGFVEWYLYSSKQRAIEPYFSQLELVATGYRVVLDYTEDPDWHHYHRFLYPNKIQRQFILNEHTITERFVDGDDLDLARTVHHRVFFDSEDECKSFLEEAQNRGFLLEREECNPSLGIVLVLVKVHALTLETVNPLTAQLVELADDNEGEYRGWSAPFIPMGRAIIQ